VPSEVRTEEGQVNLTLKVGTKGMLNKLTTTPSRVVETIARISMYVAVGLLVPWPVLFTLYMLQRQFFMPWIFVEEFTMYWMVAIICLGLAYTLFRRGHVRLDTLTKLLPKKISSILEVLVVLLGLAMLCLFVQYTWHGFLFAFTTKIRYLGGTSQFLWPTYLCVPVGYGILGLALLVHLFRSIGAVGRDWAKPVEETMEDGS